MNEIVNSARASQGVEPLVNIKINVRFQTNHSRQLTNIASHLRTGDGTNPSGADQAAATSRVWGGQSSSSEMALFASAAAPSAAHSGSCGISIEPRSLSAESNAL